MKDIDLSVYITSYVRMYVRNNIRFPDKSITRHGPRRAMNIEVGKWWEPCEYVVVRSHIYNGDLLGGEFQFADYDSAARRRWIQ